MKKLSLLVLALALVLSLNAAIFAQEVEPLWGKVITIDEKELCVTAKNPLYGEIIGLPDKCVPVRKDFDGKKGSTVNANVQFQIKSNGILEVGLNLDKPFTHVEYDDTVATHVQMKLDKGTRRDRYENVASVWHKWDSFVRDKKSDSFKMTVKPGDHPSGRGVRSYEFDIQGKLADIHEQAAGRYQTIMTVTLSKP